MSISKTFKPTNYLHASNRFIERKDSCLEGGMTEYISAEEGESLIRAGRGGVLAVWRLGKAFSKFCRFSSLKLPQGVVICCVDFFVNRLILFSGLT